jgi:hypothetical protein
MEDWRRRGQVAAVAPEIKMQPWVRHWDADWNPHTPGTLCLWSALKRL